MTAINVRCSKCHETSRLAPLEVALRKVHADYYYSFECLWCRHWQERLASNKVVPALIKAGCIVTEESTAILPYVAPSLTESEILSFVNALNGDGEDIVQRAINDKRL